jgi:hypothetical protein
VASGERAGGRAEMLQWAKSAMGQILLVLQAERGVFFLVGEPFRAERSHHLDASGRLRASGHPGARSALKLFTLRVHQALS